MLVISTRDFRANQTKFLDMVNNGEDIILRSRGKGSFKLVPVSEHDMLISKEHILEPDADFERAIPIEELLQNVKADIHEMFKSKLKRELSKRRRNHFRYTLYQQ